MRNTKKVIRRGVVALACAGSLTSAAPLLAQGAAEFEAVDLQTPIAVTRIIPSVGYRANADIDGGGEFGETSLSLRGGPSFAFGDNLTMHNIATYRFSHYDFSDLGGDPWENIHMVRATTLFNYKIDEHWSVYGGPTAAFWGEEGADLSHSFTLGGLAAFNYRVHDRLTLGAGFGIFSQIEDDARIAPLITANWQFHDHWNLRLGFSEVATSGGLGAEVTYDLTHQWKIGAGFQFQQKRFLLDEDGDIPGGVGQDKSVPIFARLGWQPCKNTTLELLFGIAAGGELLIEDDNGNELAEEDYDPSALIGLRAIFSF